MMRIVGWKTKIIMLLIWVIIINILLALLVAVLMMFPTFRALVWVWQQFLKWLGVMK